MNGRTACWVAVAGVALGLGGASQARAYTCISSSCPVWCDEAVYGLSVTSDDLGEATTVQEVQRGMDDWGEVSCTSLQTRYTGRTDATAGVSDGEAVIGWVESGWTESSSSIGVTGPRWNPRTGCISEADMRMNGVNFTWTTGSGSGSSVNAYSIVLHEGGHYYGLGHSDDSDATMFFSYGGGISSLNADDRAGICELYPGDDMPPPDDCTVTGCPSGEECQDGECVPLPDDGGADVCEPCSSSAECGGDGDRCLSYPDGQQYCGRACTSDGDCDGDDQCTDVGFFSQCVRFEGGGASCTGDSGPECSTSSDCGDGEVCDMSTGTCEPEPDQGGGLGEPCADSSDCTSGLCVTTPYGTVCSQSCDPFDTSSCPGGFYCNGDAGGTCDTGLCFAGTAGGGQLGDDCTEDTDCASLVCSGDVCSTLCIPDGAIGCAEGFVCQQGSTPGCGACKEAAVVGEPCEVDDDCASRICLEPSEGEPAFCSSTCSTDGDCPGELRCRDFGPVALCDRGGATPDGGVGGDAGTGPDGGSAQGAVRTLEGDCGCTVPGGQSTPWPLAGGALALAFALMRRRRR